MAIDAGDNGCKHNKHWPASPHKHILYSWWLRFKIVFNVELLDLKESLQLYYNLDFFIPSNPSHWRSLCFPVALPNPGTNAFDSPSYGRTWNAPSWNGWQTYGKKSELVGGGLSLSSSPGATSTPFKRTRDGPLYQSRICDGALLGAKFSFDTKQIKNQKKIKYFLKTQSCVIRTTCSLIWNVGMTHGE